MRAIYYRDVVLYWVFDQRTVTEIESILKVPNAHVTSILQLIRHRLGIVPFIVKTRKSQHISVCHNLEYLGSESYFKYRL